MSEVSNYANLHSVTAGFESKAQVLGKHAYWLARGNKPGNPIFSRIDIMIGKMPSDQRQKLTKKFGDIIPDRAKRWNEQYDERCKDIFTEILGWDWLNALSVEFRETPDILVLDKQGKVLAAMECKHFAHSEEEKSWLQAPSGKVIMGKIHGQHETQFQQKLQNILDKAEEQLNKTGLKDNKFIFMNFSLDTWAWLQTLDLSSRLGIDDIQALIAEKQSVLRNKGIEFIAFQNYDVNNHLT